MDLLDGTIVNVAAPTIREDLHSSASALQWVIGGYALAFAVGLITGGRLGDIYGRRRLFVIGALGFVAASVACAFSVSSEMLIGCRMAQGFAAAMLIPQGLGIVRDVFAPGEQASAFAVFGPVIGLSAVLGPIVGGALIAANALGSGWRLIFFVNLPLGLIAALGAARVMPESRAPRPPRLDVVGTVLCGLGMGLLVYPLIQGREAGWPLWTYLMIAGSAVAFGALVLWSRRVRRAGARPARRGEHLQPPRLHGRPRRHRRLLRRHDRDAARAHPVPPVRRALLGDPRGRHPGSVRTGHGRRRDAGRDRARAPRLGRAVLQIGAVLMAGGYWWVHQVIAAHGLHTESLMLVAPQLLVGAGIGMLISPLFDFILASVTDREVGSASGVLNALQQLAGAVGVAAIGTVFFTTLTHHGFVAAINRCIEWELATVPVLILCTLMLLPRRAREPKPIDEVQRAGGRRRRCARARVLDGADSRDGRHT